MEHERARVVAELGSASPACGTPWKLSTAPMEEKVKTACSVVRNVLGYERHSRPGVKFCHNRISRQAAMLGF